MAAWMRAELDEDAIADDEAGRKTPPKPEADRKLEEAVRRAMNDLEQEEKKSPGAAGRSRPNAA